MTLHDLNQAIAGAAGLRLRLKLQPLGGAGETIFPCTVAGGTYLTSERRVPGQEQSVPSVIIDSVQSQANRLESALLDDIVAGNIFLPHVVTDFSDVELIKSIGRGGRITCFDAPHRVFDAILRDSLLGKVHFPLSEIGSAVIRASAQNATALFDVSPASLLFGSWDSTGVSGGLGEKYARCVVSEIVGINAVEGRRGGTRVDPLNAEKGQSPEKILKETNDALWKQLKNSRKKFDKPSEINHSSVPWGNDSKTHGGVTVDYILQTTTVSLAALRQLTFPVAGRNTAETSAAARAVLAAIAMHAIALNTERGWHLRSRCDLIPDGDDGGIQWQVLSTSAATKQYAMDCGTTRRLLTEAITAAKASGLPWRDAPIELKPSPALQKLVAASQAAHRSSSSESPSD
jgi:CRISPR-associated protein Csb1